MDSAVSEYEGWLSVEAEWNLFEYADGVEFHQAVISRPADSLRNKLVVGGGGDPAWR